MPLSGGSRERIPAFPGGPGGAPAQRTASYVRKSRRWALGYLKQAGLVESPRRGVYRITARGRAALAEGLDRVDIQYHHIVLHTRCQFVR
ncbi:MAG: winged helix-turn-helix domain-containing protein, partial [Rubrobacteraceae bacterium]|nr:winged helix-turn-helix domain-containing protein [Rubrobacteraceae bacterium]